MSTLQTTEYEQYLQSDDWQEKRAQCFNRFGKRCSICSSTKQLNVHHKTYKRFGNEKVEVDLIPLCKKHQKNLRRYCKQNDLNVWVGSQKYLKNIGVKKKRKTRPAHKKKKRHGTQKNKSTKPIVNSEQVQEQWKETIRLREESKSLSDEEIYARMKERVEGRRLERSGPKRKRLN